ncbi:hypothetical protein E0H35_05070 [Rhizobium leguminosarum bv. viciae]|nr:hypothetical protein [Rhizobium leguminosarum]NKK49712.1 hypothetical protein [Rhizobium leguminosarum bv. viciae]TBZ04484.1 hypothetical protein E0H35_05070 [Rhizobium leguminosarum bv. viciae]
METVEILCMATRSHKMITSIDGKTRKGEMKAPAHYAHFFGEYSAKLAYFCIKCAFHAQLSAPPDPFDGETAQRDKKVQPAPLLAENAISVCKRHLF